MSELADLQRTLELARVAYQVKLADDERYLVNNAEFSVEILAPGQWDDSAEAASDGWTIALGEEHDGALARVSGATLAVAADRLRTAVEARAEKVRALLGARRV